MKYPSLEGKIVEKLIGLPTAGVASFPHEAG
jgi:hypothetical protein